MLFTTLAIKLVVPLLAVSGVLHPLPVEGGDGRVCLFPISAPEALEIKKTFLERISKARESGSDGDFLNTHIDVGRMGRIGVGPHSMLVIDVGGTYLKISEVATGLDPDSPRSSEDAQCTPSLYRYPDMSEIPNMDRMRWNDWVADKVVEFYDGCLPESKVNASLTFSYPLIQTSVNNAVMERASKNFCFRVEEDMLDIDIVDALNSSLRTRGVDVCINCVVNDSAATYMAGIARGYTNVIGVVVGTGSNASFCVRKDDGREVLYNSEWGSTRIPESMLTDADLAVLAGLQRKGIYYGIVDVIVGGYKLRDIVLNRLRSFHPEIHGRYTDRGEVLRSAADSAIYDSGNGFQEDPELYRILKLMVHDFRLRGMKILASMISAVIESSMWDGSHVTLILNGTAFSDPDLQGVLELELRKMHPGTKVKAKFLKNASLEGARVVSLMYSNRDAAGDRECHY